MNLHAQQRAHARWAGRVASPQGAPVNSTRRFLLGSPLALLAHSDGLQWTRGFDAAVIDRPAFARAVKSAFST